MKDCNISRKRPRGTRGTAKAEAMNIPMHSRNASALRSEGARGGRTGDGAVRGGVRSKAAALASGGVARGGMAGNGAGAMRAGRGEAPAHRAVSSGWSELPSARLKSVKCADPFASKADQFKTKFGSVFNSGGIPCRLYHGAANVSLKWDKDPSLLEFDPLLVTCAEGLCETEHPYAFASRACFGELLASENGGAKATPLVHLIVPSLRAALVSPNKKVFAGGLEAVIQLSDATRDALNPHIHVLVVQMNKRNSDKELAPTILKAMQSLEEQGGPQAFAVIKSKVPTYCSVLI